MKLTHILAAGLMMAGVGVSTEASAQRYDGYSNQHRDDRGDRRDYRDDHRGRDNRHDNRWNRGNNGNHNGWRNNHRQRCRTEWRHHRRVQICR